MSMKLNCNYYKVVLFDIGWTLVFPDPTRRKILFGILRDRGYQISKNCEEIAHQAAQVFYDLHRWQHQTPKSLRAFWAQYYRVLFANLDIPIDDNGLIETLEDDVKSKIRYHLYPDALSTLMELRRRGFVLAAVSNWSTDLLYLYKEWELHLYLDALTVSDVVGFHKPQPQIFDIALRNLGLSSREVIYVGDDYKADVLGARAADITPVLIDRSGENSHRDCLRVQSLSEVLSLVGEVKKSK